MNNEDRDALLLRTTLAAEKCASYLLTVRLYAVVMLILLLLPTTLDIFYSLYLGFQYILRLVSKIL